MSKRYLIPFFLCISVLILSEYLLLAEVYSQKKRIWVLLASSFTLFASIVAFWYYYRKFRKTMANEAM